MRGTLEYARRQAEMFAEYCRLWALPHGRGSGAVAAFHQSLGPVDQHMSAGVFQLAATRALDRLGIARDFPEARSC